MYLEGKRTPFFELPPTSSSARLHILQALFITYKQMNVLGNPPEIDPTLFGFQEDEDFLIPAKISQYSHLQI